MNELNALLPVKLPQFSLLYNCERCEIFFFIHQMHSGCFSLRRPLIYLSALLIAHLNIETSFLSYGDHLSKVQFLFTLLFLLLKSFISSAVAIVSFTFFGNQFAFILKMPHARISALMIRATYSCYSTHFFH